MRVAIVVFDGLGIGALPDAARFGDEGADTLGHVMAVARPAIPHLRELGLGAAYDLVGARERISSSAAPTRPRAAYGAMRERSPAKDTLVGHWELAGVVAERPLRLFPAGPPSFPPELIRAVEERAGHRFLGNVAASGTEIIERLGREHIETKRPIAYTSADSVFQIAAHVDVVSLDELYRVCREARVVCDTFDVGRVIARPFAGRPGSFVRTQDRRDFTMPPPEATVLDRLVESGIDVVGVGKIPDIFAHRGFTKEVVAHGNEEILDLTIESMRGLERGLVLANLIDFDMLYGHRRNPEGYARALESADRALPRLLGILQDDDLVVLTADHGNDPCHPGSDHTREHVPVLAAGPRVVPRCLGVRDSFADIGQTIAERFGLPPMPHGTALPLH